MILYVRKTMKHIFAIVLLTVLLVLPCYATEAALEDEGVGKPTLGENEGVEEPSAPSEEATLDEGEAQEGDDASGDTEGMTPEKFKTFIDEKIVPYVIVAVSAVSAIYVAIYPILAKMSKSSDDLKAAKGDLKKANEDSDTAKEQSKSMLDELRADREAQRAEQAAFEQRVAAQLQSMSDTVSGALNAANVHTREIRDMVQIGFCNNKDLVERGYAKQIARIAQGKGVGETMPSESEAQESGEQDREEVDEHEDQATA